MKYKWNDSLTMTALILKLMYSIVVFVFIVTVGFKFSVQLLLVAFGSGLVNLQKFSRNCILPLSSLN